MTFNLLSTPCVTTPRLALGQWGMREMHPSMRRFYEAMRSRGVTTPSQAAAGLNESPQTLNNWERRGISMAGALSAQREYGLNAIWLLEDIGLPSIRVSQPARPAPETIVSAARLASKALLDHDSLDPSDPTDAELLSLAIEDVLEEGIDEPTDSDALRFVQRFHRREVNDGKGGSDRSDGGAGRHASKKEVGGKGNATAGRQPKKRRA